MAPEYYMPHQCNLILVMVNAYKRDGEDELQTKSYRVTGVMVMEQFANSTF